MIMNDKKTFHRLKKTIVKDGLGSTETTYNIDKSFKGTITTKTYKNVLQGGMVEFIPSIILAYNPEEIELKYKDIIVTEIGGTTFQVIDEPAFKLPPSYSLIKFIQVRLELITHPNNGIINVK